jgi:hypothetical protein
MREPWGHHIPIKEYVKRYFSAPVELLISCQQLSGTKQVVWKQTAGRKMVK